MALRLSCVTLSWLTAAAVLVPAHHVGMAVAQPPAASHEDRWRADLDMLTREFPARQLDFGKLYQRDRFAADVDAIRRELSGKTDAQIVLALMRLIASGHAAHTTIQTPQGRLALHRLPITFQWFADGLAVTAAAEPYRVALGRRVVRIGSIEPDGLEQAVAPYISHENDIWLHELSPSFMVTSELLRELGQAGPDGRVTIRLSADGSPLELQLAADEGDSRTRLVSATDALHIPTALFRKRPNSYYWYEHLTEDRALYVQYNRCADDPKQPFSDFASTLFTFADANPIERVVVDLRFNSGGDSRIIRPLIEGLKKRPRLSARGHVSALVGPGTFSSGLLAAISFRDDLHAVLVGEPPGEKPNSYGEVRKIVLPYSQLVVQYSTKYFRMLRGSDPPTYMPDVVVKRTLADALAGRDPVLDAALKQGRR